MASDLQDFLVYVEHLLKSLGLGVSVLNDACDEAN